MIPFTFITLTFLYRLILCRHSSCLSTLFFKNTIIIYFTLFLYSFFGIMFRIWLITFVIRQVLLNTVLRTIWKNFIIHFHLLFSSSFCLFSSFNLLLTEVLFKNWLFLKELIELLWFKPRELDWMLFALRSIP